MNLLYDVKNVCLTKGNSYGCRKKAAKRIFSFTLVMGLLPYSAFADPSDSSSDSTKSSSDASTSNESEFADGGVASKPDPSDFEGGMDSNGSVSGAEDAGFGVDGDFADEQELSAPDYSDGKLAIWADGLDDPSDIADVYPPDTNEIEAYANGSNLQPMSFSSEMLYFCKYESSCNYDQGLSSGDGYHAMGYFQFDNRYGLGSFLKAVYNYNPSTYSALKVIGDRYGWNVTGATRSNGAFTQLGNDLNAAWHAAYKANPTEFSNLQNGWAYIDSYNGSLGARGCLKAFGINLDNRPDCIKGLCWGMVNLFGAGGGASYINNGNYYGANWFFKNSGINDSMSDEVFVTTLCDYVVNNVAKRYPKQSIYWTGWQNRYKSEKADCLRYIQSNIYPIEDNFVSINKAPNSVSDGQYLFKSELDGMGILQVGSNGSASETSLKICSSTMGEEQKFVLERDSGSGYVRIKNMQSSRYLGLVGSSGRYSQAVVQKEYSVDDKTLLWQIAESGGALVVKPAINTDYCLDVTGGSFYEGVSVCLYKVNGGANQRFSLVSTVAPEVEGGRTVDDGVYSVSLGSDGSVALGVSGSATGDGGNVQATASAGLASQKFRFTLKEDGFYEVRNLNSGKVLDVDHGNIVPGTNILQWSDYASDNQRWAVQRCEGGYRLVCKANGLALTLGASAGPGSNAFASTVADGRGQVFSLEPAALERVVSDGEYVVSSQVDPMQVLDIAGASTANCARLEVYESHMADNQIFRFERDDDTGFYKVTCVGSGKVLDNDNRNVSNGAAVLQYDSTGALNQRWIVQREGSGLSIRSAIDPSYCIDLAGGGASNCTKAEMYRYNGGANQRFSLVSTNIAPVSESEDFGFEGWYEISPVADSSLCVDIFNASSDNGAKSLLYNKNSNLNQLFKLEYQNGFYRLISASSGKALELKDGSVIPGVPAQQRAISDSMSQKWKITKNQDGSYSFACAANGLMLGSAEVDSNVSLSGRDGGAGENISFFLTKRTDLLKEGVFKIAYGKDQGKVVDIDNASRADGANALIYSSNSNLNQKWKVKLVSGMENTYTFESLCSGKYLSVSGSNVVQSSFSDGSGEQMWTPVDIDAGAVVLQNIATGKVLDVKGGSNSNGTNVQVYERNNSTAQKFIFEPTELVKTATYVFHSGANYGQVVDLNNASTQDGATVTTWTSNNGGNQKWNLSGNGDGTYRISNAANGKVLDVSGGTVSDGTRVAQYSWHNGLNQKWYVAYDKEGGFVFESAQNRDVVLAVGSPSPSDGASIRVEKKTGAANQRFCLEQTVYTPPMPSDRQAMQNKIWGYGSGTQWLISVDRSTHRVGVFRGSANNWTLQYWWSCVTGAPSTPTITGYYRTTGGKRMSLSTDSRAKWCTQIWNGYFFHTILNSDAELGNSLSHGCLRMSYPSAQWIYNNIYAGTTVVIYN